MARLKYRTTLTEVPGDDFTQTFAFGTLPLTIRFVWDWDLQEEYQKILRAVKRLRDADPLIDTDGSRLRDYDYIDYYTSLPNSSDTILEMLNENTLAYPSSLKDTSVTVRADIMYQRKFEAEEIKYILDGYAENQFWKLFVTDDTGEEYAAELQPGGWINSQGLRWSLQFRSELGEIGHDDLLKTELYAEVEQNV